MCSLLRAGSERQDHEGWMEAAAEAEAGLTAVMSHTSHHVLMQTWLHAGIKDTHQINAV